MVMAKIDRPKLPKPFPPPLPKPPESGPTDCWPKPKPEAPKGLDRIADAVQHALKDKDGDGGLDRSEFDAGRNPLERALDPKKFDRYDRDGNGKVDGQEFHAGREKERFKEAIRGKLDLPDWKREAKVTEAAKDAVHKASEAVKDVIDEVL